MAEGCPFAGTVAEFLAFVEGRPLAPDEEVITLVRHLKALLFGVESLLSPALKSSADDGEEGDERLDEDFDKESRERVLARFAHLPFQYYGAVFTPYDGNPSLNPTDSESVTFWLSDDLADIYHDLQDGYRLFLSGEEKEACLLWVTLYRAHWAHHATSALYALETYRCNQGLI